MTSCLAASHRRSASVIARLRSETTRVTSLTERARDEPSGSSVLPSSSVGSDKVVTNRNKSVFVFIDPRQRLKRGHAGEWAHLGCQRLWIRSDEYRSPREEAAYARASPRLRR